MGETGRRNAPLTEMNHEGVGITVVGELDRREIDGFEQRIRVYLLGHFFQSPPVISSTAKALMTLPW